MALIRVHQNPLTPGYPEPHEFNGPFIEWLKQQFPTGFGSTARVYLNSEGLALDDFDIELTEDDFVDIFIKPGSAGFNLLKRTQMQLLTTIQSLKLYRKLTEPDIDTPNFVDRPEPNTVYSLRPQQNVARLGEAMPVIYGRVITTPDLISQPYSAYDEFKYGDPGNVTWVTISMVENRGARKSFTIYGDVVIKLWSLNPTTLKQTINYSLGDPLPFPIPADRNGRFEIYDATGTQLWFRVNFVSGERIDEQSQGNVIGNAEWQQSTGDDYVFYFMCVACHEVYVRNFLIGDVSSDDLTDDICAIGSGNESRHLGMLGEMETWFNGRFPDGPRFHENVISSLNFTGIELEDTEQTEFFPVGAQSIHRIAVDFSFERGLYFYRTTGFGNITVEVDVIMRPAGGGADITRRISFQNLAYASTTAFRRTVIFDVPDEQYKVSVSRITPKPADMSGKSDSLTIRGVKGYVVHDYGNSAYGKSTLAIVRLKANELTSPLSTQSIRANATRNQPGQPLVPILNNPSTVVRDIWTNADYGYSLNDVNLDDTLLTRLDMYWQHADGRFNAVFNDRSTVFECMQSALNLVASQPFFVGGQLSIAYEGLKPVRSALFTLSNIVANSLRINYFYEQSNEPDGYEIEYRDPNNWQALTVVWPAAATQPRKEVLFGSTSATQALNYAKYLWASKSLHNQSIEFETELEGLLVEPGMRIGISHELAEWGVSGSVLKYDPANLLIVVDAPVNLTGAVDHFITVRDKHGTPSGLIKAMPTINEQELKLDAALPFPVENYTDSNQDWLYAWGPGQTFLRDAIVQEVEPNGETTIIRCVIYEESVYQNTLGYMGAALP